MSEPVVAVITRTKNRALLLDRAILSVMSQTYSDFVMTIVNDGGDPEVIEHLINKHKKIINGRISLVNNTKSQGAGAACNKGIKNSTSKYIVMHDDDDTWHPDFLKATVGYLEETGSFGVATASETVHENITDGKINTVSRELFAPNIDSINLFSLLGVNQFTIHSFLYRRDALKKVGLYDPDAFPLEDWDFNIRFISHYDIAYIQQPLAYYHQRLEAAGVLQNSMFDKGHLNQTTKLLNKYLRDDMAKNKLGIGFAANIANRMHELHLDVKRDYIQLNRMVDSLQSNAADQSRVLYELAAEQKRMGALETRFRNYIKNLPRRAANKVIKKQ